MLEAKLSSKATFILMLLGFSYKGRSRERLWESSQHLRPLLSRNLQCFTSCLCWLRLGEWPQVALEQTLALPQV